PWSAAITLIIQCAVICPPRFLWRCVEADVTDVGSSAQWHAEGLDSAIQVLVVQRVLIVPDPGTWVGDSVTNKRDTIVSWVRLDLFQHGAHARPCRNGRPPPDCRANRRKCETGRAAHQELT